MNGHQLMTEFGLKPGPQLGRLLDDLREAQAVGEVTTLEDARAWLAERIRSMSGGAVLNVEIAVAKAAKYAVHESGDSVEVIERPRGGLSVVMADGQRSGRARR